MLTLKACGTEVRIVNETALMVIVEEVKVDHFDFRGEPVFFQKRLSKKYHKGSLLLDGEAVI